MATTATAMRIPLAFRRGPRRKTKAIELIKSWHVVRGDLVRSRWLGRAQQTCQWIHELRISQVEVVNGPHKGKQGQVLGVIRDQNRVIVENLNMVRCNRRSWHSQCVDS